MDFIYSTLNSSLISTSMQGDRIERFAALSSRLIIIIIINKFVVGNPFLFL